MSWPPRWSEIKNRDVLSAIERVPRHRFVPVEHQEYAYEDRPLPIGHGQTISQPYIVALMTQLLDLKPESRVMEIGTGCGYQTAILAELVNEVFTVEVIPELSERAAQTLAKLNYGNVHLQVGDGWEGWSERAPFDGIIVTAAAPVWPPPLVEQLAEGGNLVIPVGPSGWDQVLWLATKREGVITKQQVAPVRFVPLVSVEG